MKKSSQFPNEYRQVASRLFKPGDRLRAYRAFFEAGVYDALLDALTLCAELPYAFAPDATDQNEGASGNELRPVPLWIVAAARDLVEQRIEVGGPTGKKGPHAGEKKARSDRKKHLVRYLLVKKAIDEGHTQFDACWLVSEYLEKSTYGGGADAISKSFHLVSNAFKTGEGALSYYAGWRRLAKVNAVDEGH